MINLSNFRSAFIDAQNKAEFFNAGKRIIKEFRIIQMEEKPENDNREDKMTVLLFKDHIIFWWRLDNQSQCIYLNKTGYNWFEFIDWMFIHERIFDKKIKEKISIYDSEIIRCVAKRMTQLFTGKNWHEMPLAA